MVRTGWRSSRRPEGPTSLWARRSIWKWSSTRSPTRINRHVPGSGLREWSANFERTPGLYPGSTAPAVMTGTGPHPRNVPSGHFTYNKLNLLALLLQVRKFYLMILIYIHYMKFL